MNRIQDMKSDFNKELEVLKKIQAEVKTVMKI